MRTLHRQRLVGVGEDRGEHCVGIQWQLPEILTAIVMREQTGANLSISSGCRGKSTRSSRYCTAVILRAAAACPRSYPSVQPTRWISLAAGKSQSKCFGGEGAGRAMALHERAPILDSCSTNIDDE